MVKQHSQHLRLSMNQNHMIDHTFGSKWSSWLHLFRLRDTIIMSHCQKEPLLLIKTRLVGKFHDNNFQSDVRSSRLINPRCHHKVVISCGFNASISTSVFHNFVSCINKESSVSFSMKFQKKLCSIDLS